MFRILGSDDIYTTLLIWQKPLNFTFLKIEMYGM